jgi:hypothetical protein
VDDEDDDPEGPIPLGIKGAVRKVRSPQTGGKPNYKYFEASQGHSRGSVESTTPPAMVSVSFPYQNYRRRSHVDSGRENPLVIYALNDEYVSSQIFVTSY